MLFEEKIGIEIIAGIDKLFGKKLEPSSLTFQPTRKEFPGDITLVVFSIIKVTGLNPEESGNKIGEYLIENSTIVDSYNVVKGFLNISINDTLWLNKLDVLHNNFLDKFLKDQNPKNKKPVLVEYSSPNTNKPLHLGHMRNNLLGYSISKILNANIGNVVKVNIVNDRGIHICKSMIAWKNSGLNETPESTNMKGDHLVGKYYVEFEKKYRSEIQKMIIAKHL